MGFEWHRRGFDFCIAGLMIYLCSKEVKRLKIIIMQETIFMADSSGVFHPHTVEKASTGIPELFVEGGSFGMILITLFLIALFVAAWKAPRWVKEIGIGALVVSIFWSLHGLYQMFGVVQKFGEVGFPVICGGIRVAMLGLFYGLIVYFISLVLRVVNKPRI
ncbi:MAG: hypothetical protein IJ202_13415 [Bacteroidales bacterium]|nr:hypothetical protein [Bacteroidales bacterium]